MQPSFDPRFFRSQAYVDYVVDALRRGRVARTFRYDNDNALVARTTIETRWRADEGFCRSYRTEMGVGEPLTHAPQYDRAETHVAESAIRRAVQTYRDDNGFRDLLADEIVGDIAAAEARGDRAEARAHAARLLGPASPRLDVVLDVIARAVAAGEIPEARRLADPMLARVDRPGVMVFGWLRHGLDDATSESGRASVERVEAWLSALAALYPARGEYPYWQAAALELLGRRPEALAAYTRARKMGKLKDYHSAVRPAAVDPRIGRRALLTLQRAHRDARAP